MKRDLDVLEQRRLHAAQLLASGCSRNEVARQREVSRQAVLDWSRRLARGGHEALKQSPQGRPRRLDAEQEQELVRLLRAEMRLDICGEAWPLARISEWIRERYGVAYCTSHLSRLLRRLGFPGRQVRVATDRSGANS